MKLDDVGMIKFMEEYNLAKGSLRICSVLESIKNFFQR